MEELKEKRIRTTWKKGNLLRRKVSIPRRTTGVCVGVQVYATRLSCVAVEQGRLRAAESHTVASSRVPHLACSQFFLALGAGGYVTFCSRVTRVCLPTRTWLKNEKVRKTLLSSQWFSIWKNGKEHLCLYIPRVFFVPQLLLFMSRPFGWRGKL